MACTLKTESYKKKFAGLKISYLSEHKGPSVNDCQHWIKHNYADKLGNLVPVNNSTANSNTFSTTNKYVPKNYWLASSNQNVKNAIVTTTTISVNRLTHKIHNDLDTNITCNLQKGFCKTTNYTLVFDKIDEKVLTSNNSIATETDVYAYTYKTSNLNAQSQSHIEINAKSCNLWDSDVEGNFFIHESICNKWVATNNTKFGPLVFNTTKNGLLVLSTENYKTKK